MRRREFFGILAGASVWPSVALAQGTTRPLVGYVHAGIVAATQGAPFVNAFREGMREAGFNEGQNIAVEYRWPRVDNEEVRRVVTDLLSREVAVIVGNTPPAMAAKSASSTVPIVFVTGTDPVRLGLVASFNRPSGNATGATFLTIELEAKRFGLLRDLLPRASVVSTLVDPNSPDSTMQLANVQQAARALGFQVHVVVASTQSQLDDAFAAIALQRPDALVVVPTPFFTGQRKRIVELAERQSIPTLYGFRDFPESGGLMSYGASLSDAFRQAGNYAGRIVKGEKPADLPVLFPAKFEFVINMKSARALGLTIPANVLALADEVID